MSGKSMSKFRTLACEILKAELRDNVFHTSKVIKMEVLKDL